VASSAPVVGIVGMDALRRDLARMSTDVSGPLYREIKAAGKAAVEPVAARTRGSLPHVSGTLAGSVRTSGTRTGGSVRVGRATVAYAGWIDFGGTKPDGAEREYMPQGRYLFPAAQGLAQPAADAYSAAIGRILNGAGGAVWTNTTTDPGAVHD
jgi:hypothetical protein